MIRLIVSSLKSETIIVVSGCCFLTMLIKLSSLCFVSRCYVFDFAWCSSWCEVGVFSHGAWKVHRSGGFCKYAGIALSSVFVGYLLW